MIGRNLYRALFPPHYSPRVPPKPDDPNWSRQWYSLHLPRIRVMGPLWSFGVELKKSGAVKNLPGGKGDAAALALSVLFQDGNATQLGSLKAYHRPALFRAEIESFLQPQQEGMSKTGKFSETRLSLLAVDTIDSKDADGDELIQLDPSDIGFISGDKTVLMSTAPILVSTFGDNPMPKLNEKGEIDETYLPAMQLIQGRIRYQPNSAYLAKVRKQLGLSSPAQVPNGEQVVLLPDGFCVAGSIQVPWEPAKTSGWFKATFRNFADAPRVERVLRLWFDPEDSKKDVENNWRKSVDKLQQALQRADQVQGGPDWMEVSPNSEIHPEDIFWSETTPMDKDWPLFSRSPANDYSVGLDTAGLFVRLSDKIGGSGAVTNLTIQPKTFTVKTSGAKSVRILGTAGIVKNGADKVHAKYMFDTDIRDKLIVGAGKGVNEPVPLALPLIETAEIVRSACDLPQPPPAEQLGLLWAFTPIRDGWLHWPLPNATAANIGSLIDDGVRTASEQPAAADDGSGVSIAGALAFGKSAGPSGFTETERPWSLALSDVQGAEFYFDLLVEGEPEKIGSISAAFVKLDDVSVSFDGVFLATAFRQTPERLLPEKAERALGTFGLRGVSPSNLRGIEDQIWKQSAGQAAQEKVRLAVSVKDLTVVATDKGRGGLGSNTQVSLMTEMAGASELAKSWSQSMIPWVWREHDKLPVVQSLPIAAAGLVRNAPSYARALAPLRLANPPTNGQLNYIVANLDMAQPWLDLTISSSGIAATFLKPVGQGSWRDEAVMAPTTLPSASLIVGASPRPGASKFADDWNGLPAAVWAELRYDVALRDEHNAFQRAPAAPARRGAYDSQGPAVDAVFTPLPNNGPDNGPENPKRTNGWDAVRLSVNRKAALAALDDRNMISSINGDLFLSGLFGDMNYKLIKQVEISPEATFLDGQPDGGRLVEAIGRLRMEFKSATDTNGTMAFDLLGLPAGGDLVGLVGKFQRLQDASDVSFGTAFAAAKGGWFVDQYGLRSAYPTSKDVVVIRRVQAPVPDGEGFKLGDETRLITLVKPIGVDGRKLRFWCADVPVTGESADSTLTRFTIAGPKDDTPSPIEDRANAFTRKLNHLSGFRWMFDGEDTVGGFVVIDAVAFEPMELIEFHQKGEELPTWVKVRGSLRIPVRSDGRSPPLDAGPATLTLEGDGKGQFTARLEATDVVLPLADPDIFDGLAPVLEVASLPQPNDGADAKLRFAFGGEEFACGVRIARDADGGITFSKSAAEPKLSPKGSIDFNGMKGRMGRADRKSESELGLYESHEAELNYAVMLGDPGAQLAGECKLDLLADKPGNSGTCELKWLFSTKEAITNIGVSKHVFSMDAFVVNWSADQPSGSFFGAANVAPFRGAAIAALKQKERAQEDFPSFEVSQSRLRAYLGLAVEGAADLVLTYEDDVGYRLAGRLRLYSALTWPKLAIEAYGSDWQVAGFSANINLGERFVHEATIRFDGQRLMPRQLFDPSEEADFAIPLMADVEHRVVLGEAGGEVGIGQTVTWRTFQVVRLWPRSLFEKALSKWVTPASPKPASIRNERTGIAPWQDKLASPITDYGAGGSAFQISAANNGGLSGELAKGLAAYLGHAEPASIAVEFSDHVLLAFSPGARGYGKLNANPVLCSLPALGFAGASSLPSDQTLPLSRMLACRPQQDTKVFLAYGDRYEAHVFPALDPRVANEAISRAKEAPGRRTRKVADIPSAATDFDGTTAHRAVFQSLTFKQNDMKQLKVPVDDMPTAATAFHLSSLFESQIDKKTGNLLDPSPLAIGFVGSSHIGGRDFYIRPDDVKNPLEEGSDFTRIDYASAVARLRDWSVRNIVIGPIEPSDLSEAMGADATWSVLLETRSRNGTEVISAAETKVTIRGQEDEEMLKGNSGAWAISALQRAAPWARAGLLTMRRKDFGVEPGDDWIEVVEGADLRGTQIASTRKLSSKRLMAPQPQLERWPLHDEPAAPTGYMPADIGPALFASDELKEPVGSAGGARLTATGVETAWRLVYGSHAILEDRTGKDVPDPDPNKPRESESFWIADRERLGFRPFARAPKAGPFDLSFALPTGFDEASPRALQPASVVAIPKRHAAVREAYEQAYAPAIVGTSRISVRPGAWISMRTGFSHVRFKDEELYLARSSEGPVNLRLPRPPLLAVNDRPRASSHEEGRHVVVSTTQSFMLHGPRAARPGESSLPVGLDRSPRSLFATKLELASPADGVFPPDWDGSVAVSVAQWFGTVDGAAWQIKDAALVAIGQRFPAKKLPESDEDKEIKPDDPNGRTFLFSEFSGAPGFVRGLPPATPVEFELNLECREGSVRLYRQARLTLLTTGTGVARIETPVFARFDDPEFNDMLGGLAKVDRRRSAKDATSDFVLAADVGEMRPDYRLEVALAVMPAKAGEDVGLQFRAADGPDGKKALGYEIDKSMTPTTKLVRLVLSRKRSGEDARILTPTGERQPVTGARFVVGNAQQAFLLDADPDTVTWFHPLTVECSGLMTGDGAGLARDDQLSVDFFLGEWDKPENRPPPFASLLIDVSDRPTLTANPSAFTLLAYCGPKAKQDKPDDALKPRFSAALYANGPEPTLIEIVDPRDMLDGLVRRRGTYLWRTYHTAAVGEQRYALQKLNFVGASWLPDDLDGNWYLAGGKRPAQFV